MFWRDSTRGIACAIAISCAACTSIENEDVASPATGLDENVFRCNVEPILARQCSYTACHGNAGSPLRLYTPGKLRAFEPKDIDEAITPLTEAEHHANFLSAAGFNYGVTDADRNWLLRKPLRSADGGYEHAGGAIFRGASDPQYVAIRAWLTRTGVCK